MTSERTHDRNGAGRNTAKKASGKNAPGKLRIVGGTWRGRRLRFPSRPGLRPTPDRVRETLFNWLTPVLPGSRCLDLFAGTGCLGLEAASRGAGEVWLVERDPALARVLTGHVEMLGADARVVRDDALRFLARAPGAFDVVFVDPPYRDPVEPVLAELDPRLAPGALVYVERPLPGGLPEPEGWVWVKRAKAGGIEFGLSRKTPEKAAKMGSEPLDRVKGVRALRSSKRALTPFSPAATMGPPGHGAAR